MERLDKVVSGLFGLTRTRAKDAVKRGRISINGVILRDPQEKVDPRGEILLDGAAGEDWGFFYIMMNKPRGVVCAARDNRDKTAMELLPDMYKKGSIAGRLDKDTEGLLIITDDGEMNHLICSPKTKLPKTYYARVQNPLTQADVAAFDKGIALKDFTCMPAKLELLGPLEAHVTIYEGKFHQIKRMFGARDNSVEVLKRLSVGPIELDDSLSPGRWRKITESELSQLKDVIGNRLINRVDGN